MTSAASFNCQKADILVEKLICSSDNLIKLGYTLSDTYKSLIKDAVDLHALRQTQRDWLTIRNKCQTVDCISQSYNIRQYQLSMVPRKGWKEYTDKKLGVSFSYPNEYKIGSCPQDYGKSCIAILDKPQKMPYSDYVIAFRVVNGGLKENAVKEAGFKYSDGKWIAFPALRSLNL